MGFKNGKNKRGEGNKWGGKWEKQLGKINNWEKNRKNKWEKQMGRTNGENKINKWKKNQKNSKKKLKNRRRKKKKEKTK